MTMEAPPLQSIFPPHYGETSSDKAWTVMMEEKKGKVKEESPSVKLGLGICANSAQNPVIKHGKPVFTTAQLHELQQQALIFNYIAASLPVPLALVIPIWKSVARSFGSVNGSIYKQYPSFIGFSPQGFDYRTMMDPEPGRCRRTDGKKWRCSKNVVPGQKYCERHMHRGRQRSRKHVESSQLAPPDTRPAIKSNNVSDISKTINFQLMTPSSSNAAATTTTPATGDNSESNNKNINDDKNSSKTNVSMITPSIFATTTTTSTAIAMNRNMSNSNNGRNNLNIDGKGETSNCIGDSNIMNRSSQSGNKINDGSSISPGVGFSPKSVLQVLGYSGSCFYRSEIELELGRCRRTDGKKWRCSKDVLPSQKYCARHMHRGAKKQAIASQPVAVPSAATTSGCWPCKMVTPHKEDCGTLGTNLSISISTSPQFLKGEAKSTASSSSDATITDTTILGYKNSNFSP